MALHVWSKVIEKDQLPAVTYGRARRLFSDCQLKVEAICEMDHKVYVLTKTFIIDLEPALAKKEIDFLHADQANLTTPNIFQVLDDRMQSKRLRMNGKRYVSQIVDGWSLDFFISLDKDWQLYQRAITGIWHLTGN